MASLKEGKITKIVREFVKAGDSYDITGIDLGLAKFFWRQSKELFADLATGDYRIDQSNGKQTLVILNSELLNRVEAFQVGYGLDFTASPYEIEWNVDINTLKDKYNQLVDNTQELWEYIRKTGFISDDTTIDLILPQLDVNEVWVRDENGYIGVPIGDIQESIKDAIQRYLLEVIFPDIYDKVKEYLDGNLENVFYEFLENELISILETRYATNDEVLSAFDLPIVGGDGEYIESSIGDIEGLFTSRRDFIRMFLK